MPLNGSGTYTPPTPAYPAIPNTTILASDFNTILEDLTTALSLAVYKDGQASMVANLNMATFKINNLGIGVSPNDATNVLQVFTNPTFTGTTGAGTILTGTKATITATELDIASTTTNIDSNVVTINSATGIDLTAPTITATGTLTADLGTNSTAVTQVVTDNTTKVATTAFVNQVAFIPALPAQPGDSIPRVLQTLSGIAAWTHGIFNYVDSNSDILLNNIYITNSTAGSLTLTLPATPPENGIIILYDAYGMWETNNVTIARNGKSIVDPSGTPQAENLVLNQNYQIVELLYDGTNWRLI